MFQNNNVLQFYFNGNNNLIHWLHSLKLIYYLYKLN